MAPIESLRSATTYPRRLAQVRRVIASRWAVSFLAWQLGHSTATERRSAGSWDRCATFSSRFERPSTALAHISRAFQGGKPEVAPTNAVISSVLRPDGHRISAAFFAAAGADPSGAGPLPGYLHKRLLGGPSAAPSHHLSQRRMAALRVRLLRRCLGRIGGYFRWNTRAPILF